MTSHSSRRSLLARAVRTTAVLGAALTVGLASAQSAKPVRILVGFPPGGGSDAIARLLAEKLKDELHMPVVGRLRRRPSRPHRPMGTRCSCRTTTPSPSCPRW